MKKAIIVVLVLALCSAFVVGCAGLSNLSVDDISVIVEKEGYFTLTAYEDDGSDTVLGILKHGKNGWEFIDQGHSQAYQKD